MEVSVVLDSDYFISEKDNLIRKEGKRTYECDKIRSELLS